MKAMTRSLFLVAIGMLSVLAATAGANSTLPPRDRPPHPELVANHDAQDARLLNDCKGSPSQPNCTPSNTPIQGTSEPLTGEVGSRIRINFFVPVDRIKGGVDFKCGPKVKAFPVPGTGRRTWRFKVPRSVVFNGSHCTATGLTAIYIDQGRYKFTTSIYGFTMQGRTNNFHCDGKEATLVGKPGHSMEANPYGDIMVARGKKRHKLLQGRPGPDTICGSPGFDRIKGGNGRDVLRGNMGDDRLVGGRSQDLLMGGGGDDAIRGEQANDTILAGPGNDKVNGGLNNDEIRGGSGNDSLQGVEGDDNIFGNGGNDGLFGGLGDDQLVGGAGHDKLRGGPGADTTAQRMFDFKVS